MKCQNTAKQDLTAARFEVFMVVKIQVQVFWVLTLCSAAVRYQRFRRPCCLQLPLLRPEDEGSMFLRNFGNLSQIYTASQPRRLRFGKSQFRYHALSDIVKCVGHV